MEILLVQALALQLLATGAGSATGSAVMDGVRLLYNNDGENLWAVDSSGARAGGAPPLEPPNGHRSPPAAPRPPTSV